MMASRTVLNTLARPLSRRIAVPVPVRTTVPDRNFLEGFFDAPTAPVDCAVKPPVRGTIVQKFGGTSLGTAGRLLAVADIVEEVIGFEKYTEPMQERLSSFLEQSSPVNTCNSMLVLRRRT